MPFPNPVALTDGAGSASTPSTPAAVATSTGDTVEVEVVRDPEFERGQTDQVTVTWCDTVAHDGLRGRAQADTRREPTSESSCDLL